MPSGHAQLDALQVGRRVDRALGVGDVAVAVFPYREHLEALRFGGRRQRLPEHVLLDALHVLAVLDQVRHLEHAEQIRLGRHHGRRQRDIDRAELELLQQLLVAAELARAEHDDLGLAAELGIGALGEFVGEAANSEPGSPTWPNLISVCARLTPAKRERQGAAANSVLAVS